MRTTIKTLLILVIIALGGTAKSQTYAVVDYMRVPPGGDDDYLKLEEDWKKIHQARVEQGIIQNWQFYRKSFSTASDDFQYMTVAFYDDFRKTENPFPWEWIEKNYTEAEQNEMMKRTEKARQLVKVEVYELLASAWGDRPARYIIMDRWKVKPGKRGEYFDFEKNGAQPVFEEMVEKGGPVTGWSAWTKEFGDGEWDAVTVNSYEEYGAWNERWGALEPILRNLVTDNTSWEDVLAVPGKLRDRAGTMELWELIGYVGPDEE